MAHAGEHGHPQSTGPIIQTGQLSDYVPSFEKFVGIAVPHKDPLMNFPTERPQRAFLLQDSGRIYIPKFRLLLE